VAPHTLARCVNQAQIDRRPSFGSANFRLGRHIPSTYGGALAYQDDFTHFGVSCAGRYYQDAVATQGASAPIPL
jgi:hypothetical protein